MSLLTAAQSVAIKAIRAKARTRDFTVETVTRTDGTDFYDAPTSSTVTQTLKGDWTWRDQTERRGSPGGAIDTADLLLVTDILNAPIVRAANIRLVVDGVRCAVKQATDYPDTGETVVAAVKI